MSKMGFALEASICIFAAQRLHSCVEHTTTLLYLSVYTGLQYEACRIE